MIREMREPPIRAMIRRPTPSILAPYRSDQPLRGARERLNGLGCPPQLNGIPKLNGFGLLVGAAAQNASQVQRTSSDVMTGASAGATVGSVFPGIGTAIGAAVGAAIGAIGSLFGPAKEGQAAITWDDMVNHGYLGATRGVQFDERYFGEALKGAMDKGKNVWGTKCGADGHQNPDCFYAPLARAIIAGYLNHVVPVSATEPQVWNAVVLPWLKSGAGGQVNWGVLNNEPTQQLLILAAVDRYINGLPITRANMPAYVSQAGNYAQYSTPDIRTALASLLAPQAPQQATAAKPITIIQASNPTKVTTQIAPTTAPAPPVIATTPSGSPVVAPQDTNALIQALIAQGQSQQAALNAAMASLQANGVNPNTPQVQGQLQAAVSGSASGFELSPTILIIGGVAAILLLRKK